MSVRLPDFHSIDDLIDATRAALDLKIATWRVGGDQDAALDIIAKCKRLLDILGTLDSSPQRTEALCELCALLRSAGMAQYAKSIVVSALVAQPEDIKLQRERAEIAFAQNDFFYAATLLHAINVIQPRKSWLLREARAYRLARGYEYAIAALDRVTERTTAAVIERATTELDRHNLYGAAALCRELLSPTNKAPARLLQRMAACLTEMGQERDIQAALDKLPKEEQFSQVTAGVVREIAFKQATRGEDEAIWRGDRATKVMSWGHFGALYDDREQSELSQSDRRRRFMSQMYLAHDDVASGANDIDDPAATAVALVERWAECRAEADVAHRFIGHISRGESIDRIEASDPSMCAVERWLDLSVALGCCGLYLASQVAREKSIDRHKRDEARFGSTSLRNVTACLDKGEVDAAAIASGTMIPEFSTTQTGAELQRFLGTLDRRQSGRPYAGAQIFTSERMRRLVEGKVVAVVGPAPVQIEHGDEIDAADIVIRINYRGQENLGNPRFVGSRADISYYNVEFLKHAHFVGDTMRYIDDLRHSVFKAAVTEKSGMMLNDGSAHIYRRYPFLYHGTPNAIPAALYDILFYSPARVKVYNTNFYCSRSLYNNDYLHRTLNAQRNEMLVKTPFHTRFIRAKHDYLSQLNFVRLLYRRGLVEADAACRRILDLSEREYMMEMEGFAAHG